MLSPADLRGPVFVATVLIAPNGTSTAFPEALTLPGLIAGLRHALEQAEARLATIDAIREQARWN